ncbi:hypothetical protein Dda_4709 [Drechslerella dactyloides]|uniref:F-box domain-containing protein n=1 Tax=Drechslerella dactyloides TaxID=74499 RepID=A0AAD6NKV2_DREDA|nr:hypothetical protein Dda_4709 [Drechslerella dactyloides]
MLYDKMQHLNTMCSPNTGITTLPVELRIRILEHLADPPALFAALLSCRALHDAYRESAASIRAAVLLNATAVDSPHCMFLAYALLVFHDRTIVPLEELRRFVSAYLSFANPIDGTFCADAYNVVPWRRQMPAGMQEMQTKVQECIFSWARIFCHSRWQNIQPAKAKDEAAVTCNGKGKEHADRKPAYTTATCAVAMAQIAAVARAFYRYWLYCILCRGKFYHCDGVDNLGRPMCARPDESTMLAVVESIPAADFSVILHGAGAGRFVRDLVRPRYLEFVADAKNPVRLHRAWYRVGASMLVTKDCQAIQALISRLGPLQLWEFLFTVDRDRQFAIYCEEPDAIDECLWSPWITLDNERREAHGHGLAKCRKLGKDDSTPWEDHVGDQHAGPEDESGNAGDGGFGVGEDPKFSLDPSRHKPWHQKGTKWRDFELAVAEMGEYD